MDGRPATPARASPLAAAAVALGDAPLTYAFAAVNVLVLLWVEGHGSSTDSASLVRFGALERSRVWAGEPWRLVSAAFLHAGWIHLLWNTIAGVPWCRPVERALGSAGFLVVYLASAVGASALSLLGQDVVSAGASGALFGIVGAALVLHRRGVGTWRAFLRSRASRWVLASIAAWSVLGLWLPLDQLAHAGGLVSGGAAAWLLSRPGRRHALAWIAYGAVLGALVVAACWPRAGLTRLEAARLEDALHSALRAGDTLEAHQLLGRADAAAYASDALAYYRALLCVQEGDLEGALAIARPLLASPERLVAQEARKVVIGAARNLGYRHYTGEGAARNPWLGLSYLEEACALGDPESCRDAARIRGR